MEALLQYCWKHRLLPYENMVTTDGEKVEVIDPGLQNFDAGPDFFNAKVNIGGFMWAGNVEIHHRSSEWFVHHHETDRNYNNVILHVIEEADREDIITEEGRLLPQLEIRVPRRIEENYRELLSVDAYPPCYKIIPDLTSLKMHSWMAALQVERLSQKTEAINHTLKLLNGDWEHVFFVSLARSLGMGNNSDALEQWATQLPMDACAHHRDNLFQVEAIFFGQAGMLDKAPHAHEGDDYFLRMKAEYEYLSHKFSLDKRFPVGASDISVPGGFPTWKFMRMRPQNHPDKRIAQLARLYSENRISLSRLLECDSLEAIKKMLDSGESTAVAVMINCVVPLLFAYGRTMGKDEFCERAFDMLESLKPENNTITRMWQEVGLEVHSAGDSQALIQLKKQYCDRKDCLRCRIGHEYLRV